MRMSYQFETETLPISYRMMFVSLIKQALKAASGEYFKQLYYHDGKSNKQTKNFCFAVFLKNYEKQGDFFKLKEGLDLNISSPDAVFMGYLLNGLLSIKDFSYKEYNLKRKGMHMLPEKNIFEEKVYFKTLSPIHMVDRDERPLSPYDKDFAKELNYVADLTLANYRGKGLARPLEFEPVNMKKVVIKEEISDFQKNTGKKYMYMESYTGTFALGGDVADIKDIYALGLSMRRSQGFGMIEVV